MPLEKKCKRPEGPRGQWVEADQVRLAPYHLDGEHINSPEDATHVPNLQVAIENIDEEAQQVKKLAAGLKDVVLVRRGLKDGGEVEDPIVNDRGQLEIGIWFNEMPPGENVGGDSYMPVGSVIAWTSDQEIPWGWYEADGRLLDKMSHLDLFRVLCFQYGASLDRAQFRLPDLRGVGLLGVPPRRGLNAATGMYLTRDRNRYPAAANSTPASSSADGDPFDGGPFDPLARPNTIPSNAAHYEENYQPGTLYPVKQAVKFTPAAPPADYDSPAVPDSEKPVEIPATAFCRWIIKWLDDGNNGISSVRWYQSSEGWKAEIFNGELRLFHPPPREDAIADLLRPANWRAYGINGNELLTTNGNQWKTFAQNATISWAADLRNVGGNTATTRVRNPENGQIIRIGLVSGNPYIDGRFDVPKGWQCQVLVSAVPPNPECGVFVVEKT
jgi:Phage Tail Collar Domain.